MVVTLSSPMGAGFTGGATTIVGTGTITDDDRGISITSPTVSESDSGTATTLDFAVSLDGEWPQEVTVDYAVADGTATGGSDYTDPADGTLTFAMGTTGPMTVSVSVLDDQVSESDETVEVTLSSAMCTTSCGAGLTPVVPTAAATGTIRDDDAPTFTVSVDDVAEGDSGMSPMTFTVTMTTAWDRQVTVNYAVAGGTGAGEATVGQDFRAASGTLTFAPAAGGSPGETEKTVEIRINGDRTAEPDETVTMTLTNATGGARVSQADWTGTILSDDYALTVAAVPASVAEPAPGQTADIDFTVTLAGTWTRNVAVSYELTGGTATQDVDFSDATTQADSGSATAGQLLFTQGVTVRTVSVAVNPDIVDDGGETVGGRILSPGGATLGSAQATITQAAPAVVSVEHGQTQEVDGTTTSVFQVSVHGAAGRSFGVAFDWRVTRIRETGSGDSRTYTVDVLARSSSPVRLAAGQDSAEVVATLGRAVEATDQLGFEISNLNCGTGSCAVSQARGAQTLSAALSGNLTPETAAVAVAFQPRRFDSQEVNLQKHALAGFGRTMATSIVGGIWQRANAHRSGDVTSTARIGGRSIDTAAMSSGEAGRVAREAARLFGVESVQPPLAKAGDGDGFAEDASGDLAAWRERTIVRDGESLLENSRFSLIFGDGFGGGALAVWGSGVTSSFESTPDDESKMDGSARTMLAGVDWSSGEYLAGLALSRFSGDSEYVVDSAGQPRRGSLETSLTGVTPFIHWLSPAGLGAWGSFGFGSGTAEVSSGGGALETDVGVTMLALGAKGASRRAGEVEYALRGDVFRTSMTAEKAAGFDKLAVEATRIRLALEGDTTRRLDSGSTVSNRIDLGARMDSGDGEEGAGADVTLEIRYASADGGLEVAGRVSTLLLHQQDGFREWGAGLDVAYAPDRGGRGLRLSLEPRWNVPWAGSADSLWSGAAPGADMDTGSAEEAGASLRARLGYGLGAFGDLALASPYSEMETGDGERRVQVGVELQGASESLERLRVNLYGERNATDEGAERRAMMEARLGF